MTIRVLVLLEARTVTGAVKPIFEFSREAAKPGASPRIHLSVLTFLRNESGNTFTRAVEAEGLPLDTVVEKYPLDPGVIAQLRAIVARRKPDIIWTNSVKSHFLTRLAGLHRQAKWVAFHHGYTTTAVRTRLYNQLDRWSHLGADRLVTVCDHFARLLERHGVKRRRLRVQHSPIRSCGVRHTGPSPAFREQLGIDAGVFVVLTVGRLSHEKNQALLMRALSRALQLDHSLPLLAIIVGDGPERAPLESLAAALGVSQSVRFAGHQNDTGPYYRSADIFVLPSRTEGSPNVLLEAIDAGLPIVATAVGGVPEVVTHEQSALLVPSGDDEAMAQAIVRMVRNPDLRNNLIETSRQVLDRQSPEQYFRNVSQIFEEVLRPTP